MSEQYFLRVEGVNLNNFVYDTDNLSTIRGGGLMLLEVPEKVEALLHDDERVTSVETITMGASWGLFSFELNYVGNSAGNQGHLASDVAECIRERLNQELDIYKEEFSKEILLEKGNSKIKKDCLLTPRHATIMVEVTGPYQDHQFQKAKAELEALVRWRQMCSPTIAFPRPKPPDPECLSKKVCELDYFRPASRRPDHKINNKDRCLSESTYARYNYGVWGKSDSWYDDLIGEITYKIDSKTYQKIPYLFTHEFGEIACNYPNSTLNGKMAVIFFDGNRFGRLQQEKCKNKEDQQAFDRKLRECQAEALKAIIEKILKDEEGWINPKCSHPEAPGKDVPKIRLETLLWGGDEVIWVAPAWRGWWLLGEFFKLVEGELTGEPWNFKGEPLTFSAGIIFCNHKAPIYRIKQMAEGLVYEVKKEHQKKNMVAYEVMESFDFAGPDLSRHREQRRPESLKRVSMHIQGGNMLEIAALFSAIRDSLPRRALYRFVQGLYSQDEQTRRLSKEELDLVVDSALSNGQKDYLDCLKKCFDDERAMWLHLKELWDYLVLPGDHDARPLEALTAEGGQDHVQG